MNMLARFSVIASLFASVTVLAQGPMAAEGDASYNAGYFFNAIELYQHAYAGADGMDEKAVLLFKIAECHRMLGDAEKSAAWYDKAIKARYKDPIAYLHMAEALKVQGRYDEAILVFRKYREKNPGYAAADDAVHDCEQALAWLKEPGRYRVDPEVLLNTPQYDFAPAYADKRNEDLVFSSSRPAATGMSNEGCIGGSTFDLFMSRRDRLGKWSEPVKLPSTICTEANESNAVFNARRTIIYFTRCPHEKNEALGCDIWMSRKVGNEFAEPVMLPLAPEASTGKKDSSVVVVEHPTLSADDGIMVFTSNLPGGKGGLDLWMVKLGADGMPLGRATNLGSAINTKKHDQFPFLRSNGALYFSSDGRPGMGGLDIFMAERTSDGAWGQPVNMKSPVNSSGDDLGIVFDAEKESGYLGSNRAGGKGQDDIYRFYLPELLFALQGTVYDKVTNLPIPGALVEVTGTDGSTFSANAAGNGDFSFIEKSKSECYINPSTTYSIRASAPHYLVCTDQFTTVGVEESTTFIRDQFLQPIRDSIPLPTVLYDTDDYLLTAQAKDSLEFLYQTLIENPTIVVQLRSHTDSRSTHKYKGGNMELSQKRAQTCVNYLIERGINPARMVPVGMGPSRPLVDDVTIAAFPTEAERLAAHQRNRRTDFKVLRTDFVAPAEPTAPVQRE